MTRNFRLMTVFAFAGLILGIAPATQAAFDVTTSIASVTVNGSMVATPNSFSVGTATIVLTDFSGLGNISFSIPSEAVTLSGTFSSNATIVINETIKVTNNGVTGTFNEIATYSLLNGGLVNTSVNFDSSVIPQTLGGVSFNVTTAQATSTQFGQTINNAAISAIVTATVVPEPASIAMLGLGLASVGGLAVRRRLRSAR